MKRLLLVVAIPMTADSASAAAIDNSINFTTTSN